jgi:hypothetical protein
MVTAELKIMQQMEENMLINFVTSRIYDEEDRQCFGVVVVKGLCMARE